MLQKQCEEEPGKNLFISLPFSSDQSKQSTGVEVPKELENDTIWMLRVSICASRICCDDATMIYRIHLCMCGKHIWKTVWSEPLHIHGKMQPSVCACLGVYARLYTILIVGTVVFWARCQRQHVDMFMMTQLPRLACVSYCVSWHLIIST